MNERNILETTMKKYLMILMLALVPTLLLAQAAGGAVTRPTKKTQTTTTTQRSGKKPGTTTNKKNDKPKQEPKKSEPKQQEAAGYDVTITCNVPSAALSIDGVANGTASGSRFLKTGSHSIRLKANGYEPLSRTITVGSSSTTFSFTMKQEEQKLSPVLQTLVSNMVRVEGGTFTMGATSEQGSDAYSDEKPAHQVTLSSFSIGKYEVTQEEWQAVMGSNPSNFKGSKRPVEQVSWEDCQEFIRKLNQLTGKQFRLPTEAEWEYAARGGNRSRGYKYAGSDNLGSVAWFTDNSGSQTHPVGQKSPNELGLYDMSGNVWEWCQDWKGNYSSSSQTNPTGASSGSGRVDRGGSWYNNARYCRSSYRDYYTPSFRYSDLGLRLAL